MLPERISPRLWVGFFSPLNDCLVVFLWFVLIARSCYWQEILCGRIIHPQLPLNVFIHLHLSSTDSLNAKTDGTRMGIFQKLVIFWTLETHQSLEFNDPASSSPVGRNVLLMRGVMRRMDRPVQAERKATVTQMTTLYSHGGNKKASQNLENWPSRPQIVWIRTLSGQFLD